MTFDEIQKLWVQNGGDPRWAPLMAGIAIGESGGNPQALNPNAGTGDYSVGLWQINYYGNLRESRTARYGSPEQLAADANRQAKAAIDLFGQNGAGIGNWTNDSTWNAWMRAGAPQAPAADVVKGWLYGNLGNPGAGAGSEIAGLNSSGNAVTGVVGGCGAGDPGGIDIFGAHIGTKCQLKGLTAGLMIGVGLVTMGAGLFILARNTGAAQAVLKAAPSPIGRAARALPKQTAPSRVPRLAQRGSIS